MYSNEIKGESKMLLKYYSIAALICATLSRASNITSFDLNLNPTNLNAPLWIASYTKTNPAGIPKAWSSSGWTFWQYDDNGASAPGGSPGSIPGIAGNVDVDYFKYDEATLAKFCFP
jgi:GH25 family lysozyme M1 (1,4-beta-N-acetylmuramidase)